jgi:hypothetical protein
VQRDDMMKPAQLARRQQRYRPPGWAAPPIHNYAGSISQALRVRNMTVATLPSGFNDWRGSGEASQRYHATSHGREALVPHGYAEELAGHGSSAAGNGLREPAEDARRPPPSLHASPAAIAARAAARAAAASTSDDGTPANGSLPGPALVHRTSAYITDQTLESSGQTRSRVHSENSRECGSSAVNRLLQSSQVRAARPRPEPGPEPAKEV